MIDGQSMFRPMQGWGKMQETKKIPQSLIATVVMRWFLEPGVKRNSNKTVIIIISHIQTFAISPTVDRKGEVWRTEVTSKGDFWLNVCACLFKTRRSFIFTHPPWKPPPKETQCRPPVCPGDLLGIYGQANGFREVTVNGFDWVMNGRKIKGTRIKDKNRGTYSTSDIVLQLSDWSDGCCSQSRQ